MRQCRIALLGAALAVVAASVLVFIVTDRTTRGSRALDTPGSRNSARIDPSSHPTESPAGYENSETTESLPIPEGDADAGTSSTLANVELRFLKPALAYAPDGRAPRVLVDASGPHLVIILSDLVSGADVEMATKAPFRVRILDRRRRLDTAIEVSRVAHPPETYRAADQPGTHRYFFGLRGLDRLPNKPGRKHRGYVEVALGNVEIREEFRLVFRLQAPNISFGLDAEDQKWHVNASADLFGVRGVRSISIKLYHGATELPVDFTEVRVGHYSLSEIAGKSAPIDEAMVWASGVSSREWEDLKDLIAVFEIITIDQRRLTATWRSTDRDG